MAKKGSDKDTLPETFDTFEEMADFWDTHDITDYEEHLTPIDAEVSAVPKHQYIITLSETLDAALRNAQKAEGVPLNTLINLWVQEKLQQYTTTASH